MAKIKRVKFPMATRFAVGFERESKMVVSRER